MPKSSTKQTEGVTGTGVENGGKEMTWKELEAKIEELGLSSEQKLKLEDIQFDTSGGKHSILYKKRLKVGDMEDEISLAGNAEARRIVELWELDKDNDGNDILEKEIGNEKDVVFYERWGKYDARYFSEGETDGLIGKVDRAVVDLCLANGYKLIIGNSDSGVNFSNRLHAHADRCGESFWEYGQLLSSGEIIS